MTPQIGKTLNQTVWAKLENAVRGWSSNVDTLYVVTGAMPTTSTDGNITYARDHSGGKVAIPKYYFKALAKINRQTGEAVTVAFKYDQKSYANDDSYTNHMISVKELETITGFTFFPGIDAKYKETFDAKKWN